MSRNPEITAEAVAAWFGRYRSVHPAAGLGEAIRALCAARPEAGRWDLLTLHACYSVASPALAARRTT